MKKCNPRKKSEHYRQFTGCEALVSGYCTSYLPRYLQYFALTSVVFELLQHTSLIGIASPVTLAECLVRPYSLGQIELQQDFIELITDNENIEFVPIADQSIAIYAAQIRAKYNIKLPDAFQVAVALATGSEAFLTNDVTFRRVTELQVLVLDDFNTTE